MYDNQGALRTASRYFQLWSTSPSSIKKAIVLLVAIASFLLAGVLEITSGNVAIGIFILVVTLPALFPLLMLLVMLASSLQSRLAYFLLEAWGQLGGKFVLDWLNT